MSPRRLLALAATIVLAGVVIWIVVRPLVAPPSPPGGPGAAAIKVVRVVPARLEEIRDTSLVTGVLRGGSEARLSAQVAAPIRSVHVRVGQRVRRGDLLVQLDTRAATNQLAQARAGADAAGSALTKARTGARLKATELEHQVRQAEGGLAQAQLGLEKAETGERAARDAARGDVERAEAGVEAARAQLRRVREGARPEQIRAARAGVRQVQVGLEAARKNYEDSKFLYDRGALSGALLDEAKRQFDLALASYDGAQAELDLAERGASPSEIAAAEAQARDADAGLTAARLAERSRIELARQDVDAAREQVRQADRALQLAQASVDQRLLSDADVRAAQAQLDQAQAQVQLSRMQLAQTTVTSPLTGICTAVQAHEGETAMPGMPLATVVSSAGVHLEAAAPARLLDRLRSGQRARIQVDSLPGREFDGQVRSISRAAGPDGRTFPVVIDLLTEAPGLTPGAFGRAAVITESHPAAVVVPTEALRISDDRSTVWVVEGGRVVVRGVEVGIRDERRAQIRSGVHAGDLAIVSGIAGLRAGDAVAIADSG